MRSVLKIVALLLCVSRCWQAISAAALAVDEGPQPKVCT